MNALTIIIPAAGQGKRMKSFGPKALIELDHQQTLLGRQLRILKGRFPGADVVVVVGFEGERIVRSLPEGVRVVENENYTDTNVARSLGLALRASSCEAALLVYGDLVFTTAVFAAVPSEGSWVLVDNKGQFGDLEVGCVVQDGMVTNFSYGLPKKWAQVAMLAGRELTLFRAAVSAAHRKRLFGFEILNKVIDAGGDFTAIEPPRLKMVEVDASHDIAAARQLATSNS